MHYSFQFILLIEQSRTARKGYISRLQGKTQGRDDDRIRAAYAEQLPHIFLTLKNSWVSTFIFKGQVGSSNLL